MAFAQDASSIAARFELKKVSRVLQQLYCLLAKNGIQSLPIYLHTPEELSLSCR